MSVGILITSWENIDKWGGSCSSSSDEDSARIKFSRGILSPMTFCHSLYLLHKWSLELSSCVEPCGLLGLSKCHSFLWSFFGSSYIIVFRADNPRTQWQWIKLRCKSLWLRIKPSLLVLSTKEGTAENPSGSVGVISNISFRCYFWKLPCWMTVTLALPSSSNFTSARNFTFTGGKHHNRFDLVKIGWIQKSQLTDCESSLQEFIQPDQKYFFSE